MIVTEREAHRPCAESADELAREIRIECSRALRRLDTLIGERNDVLLHQVRGLVRHASDLAAAQLRLADNS